MSGEAAQRPDAGALPDDWIAGLRALGAMPAPSPLQRRTLADARRCWAEGWLLLAHEAGWKLLDLFGVGYGHWRGLICCLNGRSIACIRDAVAWVALPGFGVEDVRAQAMASDPQSPYGVPGAHRVFRGGEFGGHPPLGTVPVWEASLQ